ncbi:MAG: helix-turn-helix domain-containing protein [Deltaproteobacteria bacterium]|nr:helix-turn-helix domain-containing protein [Deltaproteobacteria bacterium]
MESPGEYLRRERELRGVPIGKIYEATRVPMKYLVALEADEYDAMPHPTFIKGYIKTYCKALGLDETDAVLRFEVFLREKNEKEHPEEYRRANQKKKREASSIQVQVPKGLKNNAAYAIGAAVVAVIIILYVAFGGKKAEEPAPAEPQATETPVQAPMDTTIAVQPPALTLPAAPVAPSQREREAVAPTAAQQKAPDTAVQQLKAQAKEALKPVPPAETMAQQAVPVHPPVQAAQPAPAVQPVEESHTLSVTAIDVAWIKIRIDSGEPFEVYLRPGESVSWKAKELFSLIVGNAGGVALSYDGRKMPPLGKAGEVVSFKVPKGGSVQVNQGAPRPKPVKPVETVQPSRPETTAPIAPAPEAKPQTEDKKEAAPSTPQNQ